MKRDHTLFLNDILKAFNHIEQFIEGMEYEAFNRDEKTKSAVIRQLEIIGEAAKQIPEEIRNQHPDFPWKPLSGMRDRLIHGYFGIDYALVWDTVRKKLPAIKPQLENMNRR